MNYKKILNANALKFIAMISMTIDHIAWAIFPDFSNNPIINGSSVKKINHIHICI